MPIVTTRDNPSPVTLEATWQARNVSVSDDGRYVVFASTVAIDPADTNGQSDIYWIDTVAGGRPEWISTPGNAANPYVSHNGRYIVYDAPDAAGVRQVFRYSIGMRRTDQITDGNGDSRKAVVDNSGSVCFESRATNLSEDGDSNGTVSDIYRINYADNLSVLFTGDGDMTDVAIDPGELIFSFRAAGDTLVDPWGSWYPSISLADAVGSEFIWDDNSGTLLESFTPARITENARGASVGNLASRAGQGYHLDPTKADNALFEIVDGTLRVRSNIALDYEQAPTRTVYLQHVDLNWADGGFTEIVTVPVDNVVNEPLSVVANSGLRVTRGGNAAIDDARLLVTDPEWRSGDITLTLTAAPGHGRLVLDGHLTLVPGQTITQGDIDAGRLSYVHDGSTAPSDVFTFSASDRSGERLDGISVPVTSVDNAPLVRPVGTTLLSTRDNPLPVTLNPAWNAQSVSVSDDGRYVAFGTAAAVDPGDTNGRNDVYLLDTAGGNGTPTRITGPFFSDGANPYISHNGQFVVYDALDGDGIRQIWRHSTSTRTNVQLTFGNGDSQRPSIDDRGYTVFESRATNLPSSYYGTDDNGPVSDIYLVRGGHQFPRLRLSGNGDLGNAVISADGTAVAYRSAGDRVYTRWGDAGAVSANDTVIWDQAGYALVGAIRGSGVPENTPGAVVATLASQDLSGYINYSFRLDPAKGDNALFEIAGNQLRLRPDVALNAAEARTRTIHVERTSTRGFGAEYSATELVTLPVLAAPTVSEVAAQTTGEDTATTPIAFTIGDPDTAVGSLTVAVTSDNPELVPSANLALGGSGADRTLTITPAADTSGTARITLSVSDGTATTNRSFDLTVAPVNDAPTLAAVASQTLHEDTPAPVTVAVGDVDGDALTVTARSSNPALVSNANLTVTGSGASRTLTITPTANRSGTATVTLTASDGKASTTRSFSLTVVPVNDAPTLSAPTDRTTAEDTAAGPIAFTVGDVETTAGTLTVTASSSDPSLVPAANLVLGGSGANRTLTVTPAANRAGSATITLSVSDGTDTVSRSFGLTVAAVNDAPTLSAVADRTTTEDNAAAPIAFTVGDLDGDALTVTASSSDPSLAPAANLVLGGSGADRTLTITPAANRAGSATITLSVSDGTDTVSRTLGLTVDPVNDAPALTAVADQATQEDAPASIAITVGDADGDELTLTATASDGTLIPAANLVLGGSGAHRTLTITPAANRAGTATITLSASDGTDTVSRSFDLTVDPVNDAPTLSALAGQTIAEDTATAPIAFTLGDVETAPGALSITAVSSNPALVPAANLVVGGSGTNRTLTITPAANRAGSATITLSVSDGTDTVSRTLDLTVTPVGDAPTLTAVADQATSEDTQASIAFSAADADGDVLTATATSSDPGLIPEENLVITGSGASRTLTVTPAANRSGSATITLSVSDGTDTVSRSFDLTVAAVNDAPTLSAPTDRTTAEDTAAGPIAFTVGDVETTAGTLTVTASSSDPSLVPAANLVLGGSGAGRTLTVTPAANRSGTATITLNVSDGATTTSRSFDLTVDPVNDVPVLSALASQTITEDTATAPIAFTVGDVETSPNALTVTATSSDPTLVPAANLVVGGGGANRTLTVTPAANRSGSATITLSVSDGTDTVSRSFDLTVDPANDAPTLSAPATRSTHEDTPVDIALAVGDVDGDALTVTATSSDPALVPAANLEVSGSGANRTLTVTPAANRSGSATLTLSVSDGTTTTSRAIDLTVAAVNDAPTLSDMADLDTAEDTAAAPVAFTVGDVETAAGALTVTASSSDPALVPAANLVVGGSGAHRTLTVTPAADRAGTATITLTVSDDTTTTSRSFDLTVAPVNDAPTLSAVANRTTAEDTAPAPIAFTVGDLDGDALTVTATSSDLTLVPAANLVVGGSGANRTLTVTPAANRSGSATITLSVSDGTDTVSRTFDLSVSPVNDAPTLSAPTDQATAEDTAAAPIAFTIGDVETAAGALIVTATSSDPALVPAANLVLGGIGADRTLTVTPAANRSGSATITLSVSDGTDTVSRSFDLTVDPVNDAPTLSAVANRTTAEDTAAAPIAFTVGDLDGDALTVTATSSDPTLIPAANLVLGGSGANRTLTVTPAADRSGSATITLSVSDGTDTVSRSFDLTVDPVNDAPTLSAVANRTTAEDTAAAPIAFTVGDLEGDALTVTATSSDPSLVPAANLELGGSGANRTLTVTPAADRSGTATITLSVSDGTDTVSRTFGLTVTPVNDAPTLVANTGFTVTEGSLALEGRTGATGLVTLTADALRVADVDTADNALLYTITAYPRHGTLLLAGCALAEGARITPEEIAGGRLVYRHDGSDTLADSFGINITDHNDGSLDATVAITVTPVDDALAATVAENAPGAVVLTLPAATGAGEVLGYALPTGSGDNAQFELAAAGDHYELRVRADGTGLDFEAGATRTVHLEQRRGDTVFTDRLSVTVTDVNDAPTLSALADRSTNENSPVTGIPVTIGDADGDALTLTVSSNNPTLVPDANLTLAGSGASRTLSITPAADLSGTATITLALSDGAVTTTRSFDLTVAAVADAPTLSVIDRQVMDEDGTLRIPFTVRDADNDPLTLTVGTNNNTLLPSSRVTIEGTGTGRTLVIAPQPNRFGSVDVTLSVSDDTATVARRFEVVVQAVNDSSVLESNTGITVNEDGRTRITSNHLRASDVDNNSDRIYFRILSVPAHGTLYRAYEEGWAFPYSVGGLVSQAEINGGYFHYVHDGSDTTADSFVVYPVDIDSNRTIDWQDPNLTGVTVNVTVNPLDDATPPGPAGSTLATTRHNPLPAGLNPAWQAREVSVSADGRYVVFTTTLSLTESDFNNHNPGQVDVYLFDTQGDGQPQFISNTRGDGNSDPRHPVISANGTYIAFEGADWTGTRQIYWYDRTAPYNTRIIQLISWGDGDNRNPSIDNNGNVAFETRVTIGIGIPQDTNGAVSDIVVVDPRQNSYRGGMILRLSGNGDLTEPTISADGTVITAHSAATTVAVNGTATTGLAPGDLVYDRTARVWSYGFAPAAVTENATGTVVATLPATDASGTAGAYAYSLPAGQGDNALFEIVGHELRLRDGVSLDYEDAATRQVHVRRTDSLGGTTITEVVTVPVVNVVEPPVAVAHSVSVFEGGSTKLDGSQLRITDADPVTLELGDLPAHGALFRDTTRLEAGATFTQADIDAGRVRYVHDGSETVRDGFTVSLRSGETLHGTVAVDVTVTPVDETGSGVPYRTDIASTRDNPVAPGVLDPAWHADSVAASTNGRYVVFASTAAVDPADTDGRSDVYLIDRDAGGTPVRISTATDARNPTISDDGTYVAYDAPDVFGLRQVFRYTVNGGTTLPVSDGNGDSQKPAVDNWGQVRFESRATLMDAVPVSIWAGDANGPVSDIVLYTPFMPGINQRYQGDGDLTNVTVSPDGSFFSFDSAVTRLVSWFGTPNLSGFPPHTRVILDENWSGSFVQSIAASAVPENAAGATAATLPATDLIGNGSQYVYRLPDGQSDNALFEIVDHELRLRPGIAFDYEAATTHTAYVETVDEMYGITYTQIVTIPVAEVNEAPTIPAIASQTTTEDTALAPITFTLGDAETAADALTVTATSDFPLLFPDGPDSLKIEGSGAERTITLTPAADQYGTATVTLSVSDGTNTVDRTFEVTVTPVNDAPVLMPVTFPTVGEGCSVAVPQSKLGIIDPDGDRLTYRLTALPEHGRLWLINSPGHHNALPVGATVTRDDLSAGKVWYVHDGSETTTDTFTLAASDPSGATLEGVTVTVPIRAFDDGLDAMEAPATSLEGRRHTPLPAALDPAWQAENISVSNDGRFVLFSSVDGMLDRTRPNIRASYYLFDRNAASGTPAQLYLPPSAGHAVISPDGTFVAYDALDTYGIRQVYRSFRVTGSTQQISFGNGPSQRPSISDSGLIAFETRATDKWSGMRSLGQDANGSRSDIVIYDGRAGGTPGVFNRLHASAGNAFDGELTHAAISADGNSVSAYSVATQVMNGFRTGFTQPAAPANVVFVAQGTGQDLLLTSANGAFSPAVTASAVTENTAGPVVVADLPATILATTAYTPDWTYTYSLDPAKGDNALFEIVGSQLRLRDGVTLDYEASPTRTVHVERSEPDNSIAGRAVTVTEVVTVPVTNVIEPPTVAVNAGVRVAEGGSMRFDGRELRLTDADPVTLTLAAAPAHGALFRDTTRLEAGATFTQADLDAGRVRYVHDGSETTADSFSVTMGDGAAATYGSATVAVTVAPVDEAAAPGAFDATVLTTRFNPLPAGVTLNAAWHAESVAVSGDGRYVVFASTAAVTGGDSDGRSHVYLIDRNAGGAPVRISDRGGARNPIISNNGATIAYDAPDVFGIRQIFRYTTGDGATTRITDGNGDSQRPAVDDAGTLAFETRATDWSPADTARDTNGPVSDLYIFNPLQGGIHSQRFQGDGDLTHAAFDADGNILTFSSAATVLTDWTGRPQYSDLTAGRPLTLDRSTGAFIYGITPSAVAENAPGAVVATLPAADLAAGAVFTYSLPAGEGDNAQFEIAEGRLRLRGDVALDHETTPTRTVVVRRTDEAAGGVPMVERLTVTVTDVNDAPTLSALAGQTTAEDTAAAPVAFTIGDDDGDALTVSAASSDPALVPAANLVLGGSGASRTLAVTPAADRFGTATITLSVSDGTATTSHSFDLTVTPTADTPILSAVTDRTTAEDVAVELDLTVGDADGDALTVTATSDNPALAPAANLTVTGTGAHRTLTVTPAANRSGTATITLAVSDGALSTSRSFALTVDPVNDAPTLAAPADRTSTEDAAVSPIAFTIGDAETAAGALTVTASSSNPALIPAANLELGGSGANRTLTVTPAANRSGTATITLSVSDGTDTVSRSFDLTVTAVDDAPTLAALADRTTAEDTALGPIAFTVGDVETAAGALIVTATSSDPALVPAANLVIGGSGADRTLTVTPVANRSGTTTITVNVSDGTTTTSRGFDLTVAPVNDAPTLSAPADRTTAEDTALGPIAFTVGDVETAAGALIVTATSSDPALVPAANLVIGGSGADRTLTISPAANRSGSATITLSVSDGTDTVSRSFDLTVDPVDDAPTLAANTGITVTEGSLALQGRTGSTGLVTLTAAALRVADVDTADDRLAYTLAALPGHGTLTRAGAALAAGASFTQADIAAGLMAYRHDGSDTLADRFHVTVADGAGGTLAAFPVAVTVTPVADALAATVAENAPGAVVLTLPAATGTGEALGYALPAGQGDNAQFELAAAGDRYELRVRAEGTGLDHEAGATRTVHLEQRRGDTVFPDRLSVTVTDVNDLPTLSAPTGRSTAEDTAPGPIAFTVGDAETAAGALTVTATSSDPALVPAAGLVLGGSGADRILTVTPAANRSGTATITLSVSDGTDTVSRSFDLTVDPVNDAPTLAAPTDRSTAEDTAPGPIAFTVGDVETAAGALTVTATSSDPALVPAANLVLDGSGASRTLTISPAANRSGTATITLSVSDGTDTVSRSFDLAVTPVNDAPTLAANTGIRVNEGARITFGSSHLLVTDPDHGAGALSYRVTSFPENGLLYLDSATRGVIELSSGSSFTQADINAGRFHYVHDGSDTTADSFVLAVSDGAGGSLSRVAVDIAVTAVDDAAAPGSMVRSRPASARDNPLQAPLNPAWRASDVSVSDDGRYVAFTSTAAIGPDDTDGRSDVYLLDRTGGGAPVRISTGGDARNPVLSGNGATLVFDAQDAYGIRQVFRYAVAARTLRQITSGTGDSRNPSVADNGLVAFETRATDLAPVAPGAEDVNGAVSDICLFDPQANGSGGITRRLSGDGDLSHALISADGASVMARSAATTVTAFGTTVSGLEAPSDIIFTDGSDADTAAYGIVPAAVPENLGGALVATLPTGNLVDGDEVFSYRLDPDQGDNAAFEIVGNELRVRAGSGLDYDALPTRRVLLERTDTSGSGAPGLTLALTVRVTDVFEPPTVATNTGLGVAEGGSASFGTDRFRITDADAATLVLTAPPAHGALYRGTARLTTGATFSQADIDAGRIRYVHDGSDTTADTFTLALTDGVSTAYGNATVAVTVAAVDEAAAPGDFGSAVLSARHNPLPAALDPAWRAENVSVSDNGRYVVFVTTAAVDAADTDGLSDVYLLDRTGAAAPVRISRAGGARNAIVSRNGASVVFDASDAYGIRQVYLYSVATRSLTQITDGNGDSQKPTVSDLGLIAFETRATDLEATTSSAQDGNGATSDICVYSTVTGRTTGIVSRLSGDGDLTNAAISADGGILTLSSAATVLRGTDGTTLASGLTANRPLVWDRNRGVLSYGLAPATVTENAAGAVAASLAVADLAGGSAYAYRLDPARGDNALFEIAGTQLRLRSGVALDHEAASRRTVYVERTDTARGDSFTDVVTVPVGNVNEPLAVAVNAGFRAAEGLRTTVTSAALRVVDPELGNSQIWLTLTEAPRHGTLYVGSMSLSAGEPVTQAAIDAGRVFYVHDDSETTADSFTLSATNRQGETLTGITVPVAVDPVSDAAPPNDRGVTLVTTRGNPVPVILDPAWRAEHVSVSDDGRYVVFATTADIDRTDTTGEDSDVYLLDTTAASRGPVRISSRRDARNPVIAANGAHVVYDAPDDYGIRQVFRYSLAGAATTRLTAGNGASQRPTISLYGGRDYIVFQSRATDLPYTGSGADTNGPASDICFFDPRANSGNGAVSFRMSGGELTNAAIGSRFEGIIFNNGTDRTIYEFHTYSFSNAVTAAAVTENRLDAVVATLPASDLGGRAAFSYSLDPTKGDNSLFEIAGSQIRLRAGTALDYEASPARTLFLERTDANGGRTTVTQLLTVPVLDVDETVDAGLQVAEGGSTPIRLGATGTGSDATTFTVAETPLHGGLYLGSVRLAEGGTLTSADIAAGRVRYVHNGSDTVADAVVLSSGAAASPDLRRIGLTILPVNDALEVPAERGVSLISTRHNPLPASVALQPSWNARSVSVSGDGRYVAFESTAAIDPADTDGQNDVYLLDTVEGDGAPVRISDHADARNPVLSGNGAFVAYDALDVFGIRQVFRYAVDDPATRQITAGNGASARPSISHDGSEITFQTRADDLAFEVGYNRDGNGPVSDIVLALVEASGTTFFPLAQGSRDSFSPMVGPAGTGYALASYEPLVAGDAANDLDFFIYDTATGSWSYALSNPALTLAAGTPGAVVGTLPGIAASGERFRYTLSPERDGSLFEIVPAASPDTYELRVRAEGSGLDVVGGTTRSVRIERTTGGGTPSILPMIVTVGVGAPASGPGPITISASDLNAAPTVSMAASQTLNEDALASIPVTLGDAETPVGRLTTTLRSSNAALVGHAALTLTGTGTSRTLRFRPEADATGTATITLEVSDGVTTTVRTLDLTVAPVNDPPAITRRSLALDEGGFAVVSPDNLAAVDVDHTADQLTYTLSVLPAHGTLVSQGTTLAAGATFTQADINAGRVAYQHDGSETTRDTFGVMVTDPAGGTASTTVNLTIAPVDDAAVPAGGDDPSDDAVTPAPEPTRSARRRPGAAGAPASLGVSTRVVDPRRLLIDLDLAPALTAGGAMPGAGRTAGSPGPAVPGPQRWGLLAASG